MIDPTAGKMVFGMKAVSAAEGRFSLIRRVSMGNAGWISVHGDRPIRHGMIHSSPDPRSFRLPALEEIMLDFMGSKKEIHDITKVSTAIKDYSISTDY